MKIDLHIHSTASDGSYTPAEILNLIKEFNICAFSITDHDTIDGNREILNSGLSESDNFLTGVEISSFPPEPFKSSGSFHILGYGFDINDTELNMALKKFQTAREERNPRIISTLNSLDIDISMAEVIEEAGGGLIGRPHMASVLLKKGHVGSIKEAFDTLLAKGRPAFVDKYRVNAENAIALINNAGGVAVLAHPVTMEMAYGETEALLKTLSEMGLGGIEAHYSNHSQEATKIYSMLARNTGLLVTGGSDFHGSLKDDISIGTGRGDLDVPFTLYETIMTALKKKRERV